MNATEATEIPAALTAEVAAHPERFQLPTTTGAYVLSLKVFEASDGSAEGAICRTHHQWPLPEFFAGHTLTVRTPTNSVAELDAWAPVGSIDGGQRPGVGQRVLVLDGDEETSGHVCLFVDDAIDGRHIIVVHEERIELAASRWALLPPAMDGDPA